MAPAPKLAIPACLVCTVLFALPVLPQGTNFDEVEIRTIHVSGAIHMLSGAGGNIGVSVGDDGVFLIDDQFAPLTEKILAALAELSDQPPRFVFNTHWHFDHTGGNENLGESGALIVAHDNVRKRMSVEQVMRAVGRTVPAAPAVALPMVTFTTDVTFHLNDETIHAFHVPPAHTDGDSIVHFETANAVHMGDVFFADFYPFIDADSGGTIAGVIAAVERVLDMIDRDTKVIPGHGGLSGRSELEGYLKMLTTVRDRVQAAIAEGKTSEEILGANLTSDLDADWGGSADRGNRLVGVAVSEFTNSNGVSE